jgi:hypothetical protein
MRTKKAPTPDDDDETPVRRSAPDPFCEWWYPTKVDPISGASVGGHTDAERTWARKDIGRWTRRTFGINAATAYQAKNYRDEYNAWLDLGQPEPDQPFVSICVPLPELKAYWRELGGILATITKPVRPPRQRDYDKGKAPWVEPIDEPKRLEDGNTIDAEFEKLPEGNTNEPIEF